MDEILVEVFEEEQGWAYRVGNIYQPYNPTKDGFVPMTKEEAESFAYEVKLRLQQ